MQSTGLLVNEGLIVWSTNQLFRGQELSMTKCKNCKKENSDFYYQSQRTAERVRYWVSAGMFLLLLYLPCIKKRQTEPGCAQPIWSWWARPIIGRSLRIVWSSFTPCNNPLYPWKLIKAYGWFWKLLEPITADFKWCDTQTDRHKGPCIKLRYAQVISVGPEK